MIGMRRTLDRPSKTCDRSPLVHALPNPLVREVYRNESPQGAGVGMAVTVVHALMLTADGPEPKAPDPGVDEDDGGAAGAAVWVAPAAEMMD